MNGVSFHTYSAMIPTPNRSSVSAGNAAGAAVSPAAWVRRDSSPDWPSSSSMHSAPTRCGTARFACNSPVTHRSAAAQSADQQARPRPRARRPAAVDSTAIRGGEQQRRPDRRVGPQAPCRRRRRSG